MLSQRLPLRVIHHARCLFAEPPAALLSHTMPATYGENIARAFRLPEERVIVVCAPQQKSMLKRLRGCLTQIFAPRVSSAGCTQQARLPRAPAPKSEEMAELLAHDSLRLVCRPTPRPSRQAASAHAML
jgi:hypothetical protein